MRLGRAAALGLLIAAMLLTFGCGNGAQQQTGTRSPAATLPTSQAGQPSSAPEHPLIEQANAHYASLLAAIVSDDGLVRYDVLAEPEHVAALSAVVQAYAAAPLPESEDGRIALWCNAYNANVLAIIMEHRSSKPNFWTVMQVPGFFDQITITVTGAEYTLDSLLDALRALNDPRVLLAVVRGTKSSPPLRREPYAPDRLDQQLDDQARRFVNDTLWTQLRREGLAISEIFMQHADDFAVEPYGGYLGFVRHFAHPRGIIHSYLRKFDDPKVVWIPYDWRLNEAIKHAVPPTSEEHNDAPGAN